jgi:DNA polymerase-3 subunit beta
MKLNLDRETLLEPLQVAMGVVEKKQTLPILSHVLLCAQNNRLSITGTDLEVEIVGQSHIGNTDGQYQATVPGRKLIDICKALPELANIELTQDKDRILLKSGRSRFTLSTLPTEEFPNIDNHQANLSFQIPQQELLALLAQTHFAIAQQDVRYFLNGLLLEARAGMLRAVATDGHRLALSEIPAPIDKEQKLQIILPRKGVMELMRLLSNVEAPIEVSIGNNHIRLVSDDFVFTSKLIEGRFPEYERVIPKNGDKILNLDRDELKQALQRTAILCNEKFRSVRFELQPNTLRILANNPEHEVAEEEVQIAYQQEDLNIAFNVNYLLDVLSTVPAGGIKLTLSDSNSSALIESESSSHAQALYVIMPMRL